MSLGLQEEEEENTKAADEFGEVTVIRCCIRDRPAVYLVFEMSTPYPLQIQVGSRPRSIPGLL